MAQQGVDAALLAASTNPQVFTTTVSASAGSATSRNPPSESRPASSSESTSLRAHPNVTMATVRGADSAGAGFVMVKEVSPTKYLVQVSGPEPVKEPAAVFVVHARLDLRLQRRGLHWIAMNQNQP